MLFKLINLEKKTHWPSIRSSVIQEHLAKKIKNWKKRRKEVCMYLAKTRLFAVAIH